MTCPLPRRAPCPALVLLYGALRLELDDAYKLTLCGKSIRFDTSGMRFCHPSAVLAHEGETPLWAAVARQCRKVLLTLVLRARVSLKNDTVGTGWAVAPPSFRVAAATGGPRPRDTTSSPFSHWIFLRRFFSIRVRALRTVRRAPKRVARAPRNSAAATRFE